MATASTASLRSNASRPLAEEASRSDAPRRRASASSLALARSSPLSWVVRERREASLASTSSCRESTRAFSRGSLHKL